ncbi:MAG: hypothetical protein ACOX0F_01075 [Syntrophomonadaceae bacterium]
MAMNSVVILSGAKDLPRELFASRKILRCAQNDTGAALKVVKARGFHSNDMNSVVILNEMKDLAKILSYA